MAEPVITAMTCPRCGAPLSIDKDSCDYCKIPYLVSGYQPAPQFLMQYQICTSTSTAFIPLQLVSTPWR